MLPTPSQSSQSPEEISLPTTTSNNTATTKITRGHSCILCQQRKVKCDRQKPCSNCTKARVECVPSVPTAPRRRRRKFSEQDLATKLKRYEQLLKKHGIKLEDDVEDSLDSIPVHDEFPSNIKSNPRNLMEIPTHKTPQGVLFTDKDNSRYIEKYDLPDIKLILANNPSTLWEHLRDEIVDPQDVRCPQTHLFCCPLKLLIFSFTNLNLSPGTSRDIRR